MVKKRVIPCLDVAGGRVVKGVNFENLREMGEPVELARRYSELGADELVFLDITATLEGRGPDPRGDRPRGGRADDPVHGGRGDHRPSTTRATSSLAGADKVAINRAAFDDPAILTALAAEFGSQAVVCAIDARAGEVVTHAGRVAAREGRRRLGARGGRSGGGGDPPHLHRRRRNARGLRPRPDAGRRRRGGRPRDRLGRRREGRHLAEAFEAGAEAALIASIVHERPERLPELKAELEEAGWPMRR